MAKANQNTPLGTLNKVLATVQVVDFPELNLAVQNLAPEGINLAFEGDASAYLDAMTGAIPSPNLYQKVTITIHALKSQGLSDQWKNQIEDATYLGDVTVTPDTATLSPYYFTNCTIRTTDALDFAGTSQQFTIRLQGTYPINASLFQ